MRSIKYSFCSHHKAQVCFILGGPCSGKGAQSQLISHNLHYKHLSAGELLRQQRKNSQSKHGQLIQSVIRSGKIVPSQITISLLKQAMKDSKQFNKFLIDGFPRNKQNLQGWNQEMGNIVETPFIIFLNCSFETMVDRLGKRSATSNRSDDNIEILKKRFETYKRDTLPVVDWFREKNKVIEINVEKSIPEVFAEIRQKIYAKQTRIL